MKDEGLPQSGRLAKECKAHGENAGYMNQDTGFKIKFFCPERAT
jgi:hypothetical protein